MPEKLTKEIVNERIKDRNIVLIDDFINSRAKSTFKCQHNHEWKATPDNILRGTGCPICNDIKLTKEIVNERIKDRNIVLIDNYIGTKTKSTFKCQHNHEWKATPDNILRSKGCPICNDIKLTIKLTKEVVNERIKDRNIVLIDDYINSRAKSTFKCQHNHEWKATPNNILRGKGCPTCAVNDKLTKEIVNERIKDRNIVLIDDYIDTKTKSTFKCQHNHEWKAVPNNILKGHGCPTCAVSGYKTNIEGWFYVLKFKKYIKYGITNLPKRRYNEHKRHNGKFEILLEENFQDGNIPLQIEKNIKEYFNQKYSNKGFVPFDLCPDGYTETISNKHKQTLLKLYNDYKNKNL